MKYTVIFIITLSLITATSAYTQQSLTPGIINGEPANAEAFPFYVALNQNGNLDGHRCGGVLINSRWMLTAAHCNAAPLLHHDVLIGLKKYGPDVEFFERATPEKIFIHEHYRAPDTQDTNSDIALIKFKKEVSSTTFAQLDGIDDNIYLSAGKKLTVIGFGLTEKGKVSPDMLKTEITIFDDVNCIKLPSEYPLTKFDPKLSLCAGQLTGGTANGDSGGPLMAQNSKGEYILVGLVSRTLMKPYEQWPKIAAFKDWITKTIKAN